MGDLLRKSGLEIPEDKTAHDPTETVAGPDPVPASQGALSMDRIRIRLERKHRGGKTVTVIEGLPSDPLLLTNLLKQLKATLGCGGAVEAGALVLQGDLRDRVQDRLDKYCRTIKD